MASNKNITLVVSPEHMEALERASKDSFLSKSAKVRQIVMEYLKEHGYLVTGASNGREEDE